MTWGGLFQQAWAGGTALTRDAARQAGTSPESAAALLSDGLAHTFKRLLYADQDVRRGLSGDHTPMAAPMDADSMALVTSAVADVESGRVPPEAAQAHVQRAARQAASKISARAAEPAGESSASGSGTSADPKQQTMILPAKRLAALSTLFDSQLAGIEPVPDEENGGALANTVGALFDACHPIFLADKPVDSPIAPSRALSHPQEK